MNAAGLFDSFDDDESIEATESIFKITSSSAAKRYRLEREADRFLRAHNVKLRTRSDVATLSLDDDRPGKQVSESRVLGDRHGSWNPRDPRYTAMQLKYGLELRDAQLAYPAPADSMSSLEHEELRQKCEDLIEAGAGTKTFRRLLLKIVEGGQVSWDNADGWLPKIARMREEGVLS